MTKTFIDNIPVKNLSFEIESQRLFAHADIGYLVVGKNLKVVAVNAAYKKFHELYSSTRLVPGEVFKHQDIATFPETFRNKLQQVFSGELQKASLQIEYLGDRINSFTITAWELNKEQNNAEGACVLVQKNELPPSMHKTENEEFFKLLVNKSTGVYQLADAALVFTYASNAIEEVLGFLPNEIIGKNAIEIVHPDDREQVRNWLIDVRRSPDKLLTNEYRIRNKQGNYVWIENNARNMLATTSIKAIVMNFRNIQAKKVADHALVQAEQRLSLLLNNTAESFIILNSRLRIITYNKAAQDKSRFFYNDREVQSGVSILELISKEEVPEYLDLFEQVFVGNRVERETRFVDETGTDHIYSHTFRPLFDTSDDIFGVFITSTDITERKKLTEEVAMHSERLRTAQSIAKLGYFEYDLVYKQIFCSQQFYEILGLTKKLEKWHELSVLEQMINASDRELLKAGIEKSVSSGRDFTIEFRLSPAEGSEKVILAMGGAEKNDSGVTTKFRVTLQDITDSKMAILALQTLETKFKSLFENSIDGVILSNEQGEIISANPSVCHMLGYTQGELTSLNSCDLLNPESPAVKRVAEILTEGNGAFVGELMLRHKKGFFVPVEVTSIRMNDANNVPYHSTIIRDITEKKKIEREQKALTEELLKNNQDLQQFSFITSHNLRAPVANLISLLALYNKENPADEFNHLLIEKFEEATQQLNQTLNDLVNVLVIKSNNNIEREKISFKGIFTEVKKNVDNLLMQKNGSIYADFSEVDQIQYNRIHVESIFLNMITNAIKYSSPDRDPEIRIRSYYQDSWVVVEFADNGLGINLKRYGDRLFGLYQRFHGHKEGKGLGLYMTRSQVTAMGGKIEVESEPGKGTTFKVYIKT